MMKFQGKVFSIIESPGSCICNFIIPGIKDNQNGIHAKNLQQNSSEFFLFYSKPLACLHIQIL